MKKIFITSLSIILVTVLAFVCISKPLQARADSASMDYVETDMSTSEVKALFSGTAAFIPAAIMIIGFIVMTYCVLRNIEVPLQFSDQTSFSDKLTQLGQYAIDNAGDSIKDFLYSVYTYCNDNGITSIWGLSKFIGLQAGKFFGAITSWIGGSLIQNRSSVGDGLVQQFLNVLSFTYSYNYNFVSQFSSVFNANSSIPYSSTFGTFFGNYWGHSSSGSFYHGYSLTTSSPFILVFPQSSKVSLYFYTLDSTGLNIVPTNISYKYCDWQYATSNMGNVAPSLSTYSTVSWVDRSGSGIVLGLNSSGNASYDPLDITQLINYLNELIASGIKVAQITASPAASIPVSDLPWSNVAEDVLNPAVDNVYVPTDVWNIDIVGTWEQIARDISATYDQTERIAAFVGDIPLTLTSAQAYAPTINDAGNYVFPDMTDIWKYPQYFFDTLKGWGSFVGNCLRAVTVGEGGLSWIFYGGFVLLVCGGIIGKILMG